MNLSRTHSRLILFFVTYGNGYLHQSHRQDPLAPTLREMLSMTKGQFYMKKNCSKQNEMNYELRLTYASYLYYAKFLKIYFYNSTTDY